MPGPGSRRELRKVQRPRLEPRPPATDRDGQPAHLENIVLGRTAAHPRFSGVCEPCSIVLGFTGTPTTEIGHSGLDMIMSRCDQAARWAERNTQRLQEAARLTVHYMTPDSPTQISSCQPSSDNEDLNPPSSGPSLPSSQPAQAVTEAVQHEDQTPEVYKPTQRDFEQLSAFYRDLNPRLNDAQVRASVVACAQFWEGPIGPTIEKMRSKLNRTRKTAPAITAPRPARQRLADPVNDNAFQVFYADVA